MSSYSIKQIGLILGLKGKRYEESNIFLDNQMIKQRFKLLSKSQAPLEFHPVWNYKTGTEFSEPIQSHGDLRGIHAGWEGHVFSMHLIKDGTKTHLIYVNRGEQYYGAAKDEPTVSVFTFEESENIKLLMSQLIETCKRDNKQLISSFIVDFLTPHRNQKLSKQLSKSNQKVNNCTVANANIAWHFALAAEHMKETGCSFSEAYDYTKIAYKTMRIDDRARAFSMLLTDPEADLFKNDALLQILGKISIKDKKHINTKKHIPTFIDCLYEASPDAFNSFIDDICTTAYDIELEQQVQWIIACKEHLEKKELYSEEKKLKIEQSITSLKILAHPTLPVEKKALYLKAFPAGINLAPKHELLHLMMKSTNTVCHHLSAENVKLLFNQAKYISKDYLKELFKQLSSKQIQNLLQDGSITDEVKKYIYLLPEKDLASPANTTQEPKPKDSLARSTFFNNTPKDLAVEGSKKDSPKPS